MGMVIQDDFWQACQALPAKQQAPFILAIVEYGFTGKEPAGKPAWLPTFIVIRDRIKMSAEASEKGRKMAAARWGKHDAQAYAQANATAYAQASCTDATEHMHKHDAKSEIESEIEIPPYNPPTLSMMQEAPFWLMCLGALNDTLGTSYTTMPEKCRHTLERCEEGYTIDQVRSMISYKQTEWQNTKFRKCLTPNTLFSPDHFEQYMHEAKGEAEEVGDYAKYDR